MRKKLLTYGILAFLVLTPLVFLALPKDYFDDGIEMCPSMLLLNKECPGCGLTRGVMHLIHLDFDSAAYFNPLSFILLPILGWVWIKWTLGLWKDVKDLRRQESVEDSF